MLAGEIDIVRKSQRPVSVGSLLVRCRQAAIRGMMASALAASFGCARATQPPVEEPSDDATCPAAGPCLLITGSYGPPPGNQRALVFDPLQERVLGRIGPVLGNQATSSLGADSTTLSVAGDGGSGYIVAGVDVFSGSVVWTYRTGAAKGEYLVFPPTFTTQSADGEHVYQYRATRQDTAGLVALAVQTGKVEAFFGPWDAYGRPVELLTAGHRYPVGTVLVNGSLIPGQPTSSLVLLSPELVLVDSMTLPDLALNVVLSADERFAYYVSPSALVKVDLVERTVLRRVALASRYFIAMHPDGSSVYVQNVAAAPSPGLLEFTTDLVLRRSIPLVQLPDDSLRPPPQVQDLAIEPGGQRAFVLTGDNNPYAYAYADVRVLDLAQGVLTSVIHLNEVGPRQIHAIWR